MPRHLGLRVDDDVFERLEQYAAQNNLPDVSTVARLALMEQLKRKPPKKLPPGVERKAGNPDPVAAGLASAAARRKSLRGVRNRPKN